MGSPAKHSHKVSHNQAALAQLFLKKFASAGSAGELQTSNSQTYEGLKVPKPAIMLNLWTVRSAGPSG